MMFRFLRNVFLLLIVLTLPLSLKLYNASPEERQFYIRHIQQVVKTGNWQVVREQAQQLAEQLPPSVIEIGDFSKETFQQIASCGKTETLDIAAEPSSQVYRWTDASGAVHFGDRAPGDARNSENLSVHYPDRTQYFQLNLVEDTSSLPAFTRDKISADVRQIYRILARELELEHLRKVALNLRIIGSQEDFQAYKTEIAPLIRTRSGFYSSKTNEAVVYQSEDVSAMRAVARHESSHVIMAGLYGYTPTWFNEGMAEYFEQLSVEGQARKVEPARSHYQYLKQLVQSNAVPSLAGYLITPPAVWYAGDLRQNYALAWSIIYYLMSHTDGVATLREMMTHMSSDYCGMLMQENFIAQYYPGGLERFEDNWRNWLLTDNLQTHRY